jgi:hypothetical protein
MSLVGPRPRFLTSSSAISFGIVAGFLKPSRNHRFVAGSGPQPHAFDDMVRMDFSTFENDRLDRSQDSNKDAIRHIGGHGAY